MSTDTANLNPWLDDEPLVDADTATATEAPATSEDTATEGQQADQQQGDAGQATDTAAPATETPVPVVQRSVSVSEHMSERKARQAAQESERAAKLEAETAKANAEYYRLLAVEGEDAADAYAAQYNGQKRTEATVAERTAAVQSEADQAIATASLQAYDRIYTKQHGERYTQAVDRLVKEFGGPWVAAKAREQLAAGEDPGAWALDFATNRLAKDPEAAKVEQEAEIERRAEERYQAKLKETLSKNQTPAHRVAASSVARASSEAASDVPSWMNKDPEDMNAAELKQAAAAEREQRRGMRR